MTSPVDSLTHTDDRSSLPDAINRIVFRDRGNTAFPAHVVWRSTGSEYTLDIDNAGGNHANFGGVLLVADAGISLRGGTTIRLYDAANTDYAQLASDPDGGLAVTGSGGLSGWVLPSAGVAVPTTGGAAAPRLTFTSDFTTGIYLVSAGHLGLAAGGVKVVEVVNAGGTFGVGIGMVPIVTLDVQRSSATWVASVDQTGSGAGAKGLLVKSAATGATDTILEAQSGGVTMFAVQADGGVTGLPWTAFTPTVVQGIPVSVTVSLARYRILGKLVTVQLQLSVTGTGALGTAISIHIPPAIQHRALLGLCGVMMVFDSSASLIYTGVAVPGIATSLQGYAHTSNGPLGTSGFAAALASGDALYVEGSWEIA